MRAVTAIVLQVLVAGYAQAYGLETHRRIALQAVNASRLAAVDGPLADLGLAGLDADQGFVNSEGKASSVGLLIRDGAQFEDGRTLGEDGCIFGWCIRVLNHFFDPQNNGRALSDVPIPFYTPLSSPDWALESDAVGNVLNVQRFSFKDARGYFLSALTSGTETDRRAAFGLTFQTLGQVIHHLADMAQPQHTRDEEHLFNQFFEPDVHRTWYEEWTEENLGEAFQDLPPYPVPNQLAQPRDFWADGHGAGIAEFSSDNFVSAGHNFTGSYDASGSFQIGPAPDHRLPDGDGAEFRFERVTIQSEVTGEPVQGTIRFIETPLRNPDGMPLGGMNSATSSYGIFDDELTRTHLCFQSSNCEQPGINCRTCALFTVNRFNFKAGYPLLIPRAIAYSAGLIDYFFRGVVQTGGGSSGEPALRVRGIDLASDHGQLEVTNYSGEDLSGGDLEIWYDDRRDGLRKRLARFSVSLPGQEPVAFGEGETTEDGNRLELRELLWNGPVGGSVVVLYRGGTLGKETIGADGAIAARVCKCAYDDPNNVARCEGVCDCPTSFTVTNILNGTAFPLAMNRYGQVAGAWFPDGGGACCGCQGKHGFRWNPDGSYDDIPGFGTGTCQDLYNAYADGINDFGTVVGQSSNPTGVCFGQPINLCYGERAFVSTGGSSATPIPTPGFNASGRAINNANQVVGDEVDAANNQEGFFCDGSGCVRLTMAAFYLNNLGQILGYLPSDPSGSNGGWYLREPDGTTVALADDVFPFINDVGQLPAATGVYYSRSLCSGGSQAQRPCDPVRQGEDCPDGECVAAGTIKSLSGILGNRTTGLINSRGDMLVSDSGTGEQFLYCNGNSSLVRINVSLDYDSALNDTRHIIGGTFSGAPPLFIAPQ